MEDLLNCKDHQDVTIVCDDGEIKSSKFILSARSEYFATMFKSDYFKESGGKVEMYCTKKVMEKVIEYLYGGVLNSSMLSPEDQLHLLNMFRMMMLQDASAVLEDNFLRDFVSNIDKTGAVSNLKTYVDLLELALPLKLDYISSKLVCRLGLYLSTIMDTIIKEDMKLPKAVVVALADHTGADVFAKFRLINHFKDTFFVDGNIPHLNLNLNALTIDQLLNDVAPSGLYKDSDVFQIVIAKQKAVITGQKDMIDRFEARINNCVAGSCRGPVSSMRGPNRVLLFQQLTKNK